MPRPIARAAAHGGTDGLVRHSGHGVRYAGTVHTTRAMECGMSPSAGTVGDSYGNAMAESVNGAYETGLVRRREPLPGPRGSGAGDVPVGLVAGLEAAAPVPGPQDTAGGGNRVPCKPSGTSRLTIRAEQKSGHFNLYFFSPIIGVHIIR